MISCQEDDIDDEEMTYVTEGRKRTSSQKGNDRSPESNVPTSSHRK